MKPSHRLVAFDLDGTLAYSKQEIQPIVIHALINLIDHTKVAIITGGSFDQIKQKVINHINRPDLYAKIYIAPTDGASLYVYRNNQWETLYNHPLSKEEESHIVETLNKALETCLWHPPIEHWGDFIESRQSQVTFSGLGQGAPLEAKKTWDKDMTKRRELIAKTRETLRDFDISIGGSTSIDITRKGINKAYALNRLIEATGIGASQITFIGDKTEQGGNDHSAYEAGVNVVKTNGPEDTVRIIQDIIQDIS